MSGGVGESKPDISKIKRSVAGVLAARPRRLDDMLLIVKYLQGMQLIACCRKIKILTLGSMTAARG
jgi:hypothetical protein